MTAKHILIIEDEHALGMALEMLIRRMGHLPTSAASAGAGFEALASRRYEAVVLDIGLPDQSGLQVLEAMRRRGDHTPVLVITAHATLDHAIHAQKLGATGYLTKPLDLRGFENTLAALLAHGVKPPSAAAEVVPHITTLIGAAPCLRDAFVGIGRACSSDLPVLISGPSGVGKTLTARVIHAHGSRAKQTLSFIDATVLGKPSELPAGTVVLEEINNLSQLVQSALAEWLAEPREGRPRMIATTSVDPLATVRDGRMRTDLFYALSTLAISLPPLSERSGDIPALAAHFSKLRGDPSSPILTPPVLAALQAYPWPGNVRELRHVLDYAISSSAGGPVFLSHLPSHLASSEHSAAPPGEIGAAVVRWLDSSLVTKPDASYDELLEELEAIALRHLMERFGNKPTHLAAALRIHRATLRQKLRRAGLRHDNDG